MGQTASSAGQSEETYEELALVLAEVNRALEYRELYLIAFERLVISKVLKKQITLYNLGSQRKIGLRSLREGAALSLQIKIHRRNVFFLRARAAELKEKMQKLRPPEASATPVEPLQTPVEEPAENPESMQKVG